MSVTYILENRRRSYCWQAHGSTSAQGCVNPPSRL